MESYLRTDFQHPSRKRRRFRFLQGETDSNSGARPILCRNSNSHQGSSVIGSTTSRVSCGIFREACQTSGQETKNLALPPVQGIKKMWDYRFRKASGINVNGE